MRRRDVLSGGLVAAGSLAGFACAAAAASLYDALGGEPGVVRIIDTLYRIALVDDRIKGAFDNINIDHLKARLEQQVCQVADGPCRYTGVSMKGAHRGLDITDAQFNALVEDLQAAMDQSGISSWTQNRLLARLAPMRRDVVTR